MRKQIRILMLEDNPPDVELITREIRKSEIDFITLVVDSKEEFTRELEKFEPDLVLSDHSLPQFNSIEALKIFKGANKNIPFILVTGSVSEEFAVQTIKEGADDYLLKDNLARLPQAILSALEQKRTKMEKERAVEELKRSEERYRQIVETAQEGIWMIDENNITSFVNKKICEILEYNYAEMIGKKVFDFMPENERAEAEVIIEKQKKELMDTFEFRFLTRSGREVWANLSTNPIYNKENKYVGALGMVTDITARKLADTRLEQKNKELVKVNAELDRFVYSASHELRAPLTSVLGLINIARMDEADPERVYKLDLMETSIKRLDGFIQDIVHYSRNSRLEVENEKIDFSEIIFDCIDDLGFMEGTDKIKIKHAITGNSDFFSDKKRIIVVFNNILSNAIKYHQPEQAEPWIDIKVHVSASQAVIEIRDNGSGIPDGHLDKIFNMFYRVSGKQMGSGIGLFIVKEILDKMKAGIRVESRLNEGSTFFVTIPNNIIYA